MKLLIVDNEELLVEVMRLGFDAKGVETLAAYSGKQALGLIQSDAERAITAILTDIAMPGGMSGWDLINEVKKFRPDISFMVLSAERDAQQIGADLVARNDLCAAFDKSQMHPVAFAEKVLSVIREPSKPLTQETAA